MAHDSRAAPADTDPWWTRLERLSPLIPLLCVLIAYSEAPLGGFVWDDHALIPEQDVVISLSPISEYFDRLFWSDPFTVSREFYRPLVTLSYALEYQLWEGSPPGFHLTNVLLHLMVTGLVLLLIRRGGGGPWAAALGATLFGVAPRLTESVAWISGRTDVMATLFALLALALWPVQKGRWLRCVLASSALLLGLLSKEVAAAALFGILLREMMAWSEGGAGRSAALAKRLSVLFSPLALYALLRIRATRLDVRVAKLDETIDSTLFERSVAAVSAAGHYVRMIIFPWRPETQIGRLGEPAPWPLMALGAVALVGGAALLVWAVKTRRSSIAIPLVVGGAALAMVLHLVHISVNILAADRFLYLPLAMLAVGASPALESFFGARGLTRMGATGGVILALTFIPSTRARVADWADEQSFWTAAAAQSGPGDFLPSFQLASFMMDQERWDLALVHLRVAEQRYGAPGSLKIWNNIALTLDRLGRREEAVRLYEQMKADRPANQRTRFNLVMVRLREGRFDDAQNELRALRAIQADLGTIVKLEELTAQARTQWGQLGPSTPGEPVTETADRAQYHEMLGAMPEAREMWMRVLGHPRASAALRERGSGFLVFHGDRTEAEFAIRVLQEELGSTARVEQLERVFHERMAY